MADRDSARRSFLKYAQVRDAPNVPAFQEMTLNDVIPNNNSVLMLEIESLKREIVERSNERENMMVAGKNLEYEKAALMKDKADLVSSGDELMKQISKRFDEVEALKKSLDECSKERVREVIKDNLNDCSEYETEIEFLKTKVRVLEDELIALKPVKGFVCTTPFNRLTIPDGKEGATMRLNSCEEVRGSPGSFDNVVRVPGGRFTNITKCAEACHDDTKKAKRGRLV